MKMFPLMSKRNSCGVLSCAAMAGPPSPEYPLVPLPASTEIFVTIQLRDLTNVQFSILNVHPMGRRLRILCRLLSPRMRIEHCELSIGQIYQNVLNSYKFFCCTNRCGGDDGCRTLPSAVRHQVQTRPNGLLRSPSSVVIRPEDALGRTKRAATAAAANSINSRRVS